MVESILADFPTGPPTPDGMPSLLAALDPDPSIEFVSFLTTPFNDDPSVRFEPREMLAGYRTDFDIGRVFRLSSLATICGAGLAIQGAVFRAGLERRERWISGVVGVAYLGVGVIGVWASPSHMAVWFQRRPRRVLVVAAVPLLLAGPTGGAISPLKRLATIGVGAAAGVRERRRDGQLQAVLAAAVWCVSPWLTPGAARITWLRSASLTLGFVLSARFASTASQVAYDNRNLFDQLFESAYEREDLEPYVRRLRSALLEMQGTLLDAIRAKPSEGVDSRELFDQAVASLGRLAERLGVLEIASLSRFDLEGLVRSIRPTLPSSDYSILENSAIAVEASDLKTILERRAQLFTDLSPGFPAPDVTVDPDVTVRGLQRLALIGACVTAATTNALRHASGVTRFQIHLTQVGTDLSLTIANDGAPEATGLRPNARRRSGLTHLRRKIEDLGERTPTFEPTPGGGYRAHIILTAASGPNQLEFWTEEIRRQITVALDQATRLAAVKSIVTVVCAGPTPGLRPRRQPGARDWRSRWCAAVPCPDVTTLAHASLPVIAERLASHSRPGTRRVDFETAILVVSAALNYRAARDGLGLSTTWVNIFTSRYAFAASDEALRSSRPSDVAGDGVDGSQHRAYALAALNAAAIVVGRQRSGRPWLEEVMWMSLGPLLVAAIVNPAQPRTRLLDRAINERLSEVESLYDLADSFHATHPAPPKIRDLAGIIADPDLAERLREGLAAITSAEDAMLAPKSPEIRPAVRSGTPVEILGDYLKRRSPRIRNSRLVQAIWPEPKSYHNQTIGLPDAVRLGEYLARALARRIWPSRVLLEFDHATLRFAPQAAVESAAFRRKAMAAMDIVGRQLNREFGRRWDGVWLMRQVDLRVSVIPYTGTLVCEMVPWAPRPSGWRRTVDRMHAQIGRIPLSHALDDPGADIQRLLDTVDASLAEWDIYDEARLDDSTMMYPKTGRRELPIIARGIVSIQLHPQQYAPGSIHLARHATTRT